jgi:tetratricopeptide (TPR) repeat protein
MNGWQAAAATLSLITGAVFDEQHHPVPAAKVYLQSPGKQDMATETDAQGVYRFSVTSGSYTLRVDSQKQGPFTVSGGTVTVDLSLQPQFFDAPAFTVAGVTDNAYRGGHGSDTVLRSAESLAKSTAALDEPHHTLAESYEKAGKPLDAVREFQRAAELNPSEINLFDWGTELLSHRAPQAAAEVFDKAVRLYPESVRSMLGLATAWYTAGVYENAAQWFFKAADVNPSDPKPYLFLGKIQAREITESAGYRERLARFAKLAPDNALANYYYAVSLCQQRDYANARKLLRKAVVLDPHMGAAYLQLGIIENSVSDYQKAMEADPALEEAHYRLAEAYRLRGDTAKAKEEMAIYNKLSKESDEAVERERREMQRFVVALGSATPGH